MSQDYGVIQEQGFVQGNGLGFKPLTEQEKKAIEDYTKKTEKDK